MVAITVPRGRYQVNEYTNKGCEAFCAADYYLSIYFLANSPRSTWSIVRQRTVLSILYDYIHIPPSVGTAFGMYP